MSLLRLGGGGGANSTWLDGLAVVAGGVAGTVSNALARALTLGSEQLGLMLVPGRYLVAIAVCAALPLLDRHLRTGWFWTAGTALLTVLPSLLSKFVFGSAAGWPEVLGYNLVYALAAIVTYRLVVGRAAAT